MKTYIASSDKYVEKIQEDIYLRDFYNENGFNCEILTLNNIVDIANSSDTVILKSIWGYHLNYKEFINQILTLKERGVNLVNDYDFIFWNVNKFKYLSEMENINLVPTRLLSFKNIKSKVDIRDKIIQASEMFDTDMSVVKPCVSASGYLTVKYDKTKNNDDMVELIRKNNNLDFIIQPFRSSVLDGELSVIVINGSPMYGVKRFPGIFTEKKDVDYFNQEKIPDEIINQIKVLNDFFVSKFKSLPRICRVDFVKNDLNYEIMEIELIDPDLFFRFIPKDILKKCMIGITSI